jgi:dienelactone hydrolase
MRTLFFTLTFLITAVPALAQTETTVDISSRGQQIRALLIKPTNEPIGSVILQAGGYGRLDLAADGRIWQLMNNQLVYTRALYAKAGYVTLVPDIAGDFKTSSGTVKGYQTGAAHAQDIGAITEYLRKIKPPVVIIGTSRGTISVTNAIVRLSGSMRPDAAVITSPEFGRPGSNDDTVQKAAGNDPRKIDLPLLVVVHKKDTCPDSNQAAVQAFTTWYARGGGKFDLATLDGSGAVVGKPCDANSPHGFVGLDQEVVNSISGWIKQKNPALH